jgi:peptidoglycan/LPS O-acetylase OafA/YrhL
MFNISGESSANMPQESVGIEEASEHSPTFSLAFIDPNTSDREALLEKTAIPKTWSVSQLQRRISNITTVSLSNLTRLLWNALLPSWFHRRPANATEQPSTARNIATLDGLRGIACLIVVNHHFTYNFTETIMVGWGVDEENKHISQLPGINLLWDGQAMVAIFFVLSGFVLSHKPLSLSRSASWAELHNTVASSAFRRVFRLYIPVLTSTLIIAIASCFGVFDYARIVKDQMGVLTGNEPCPDKFQTLTAQLSQWWGNILLQINEPHRPNTLDLHTWTIPIELLSSMTLFVTVVALSRLAPRYRIAFLAVQIMFTIHWNWEGSFMFLTGMMLVDLDYAIGSSHSPESGLVGGPKTANKRRITYVTALLVGVYLASTPYKRAGETPGYQFLASLTPPSWRADRPFWKSIGATVMVWVVRQYRPIQPLFTNALVQYLGQVGMLFG